MIFQNLSIGDQFSIYPDEYSVVWTKIETIICDNYQFNAKDDDGEMFFSDDQIVFLRKG